MNALEALNRALFLSINAAPSTPVWLIDVARYIADDVIYVVPLVLAVLWLAGGERRRAAALRACCVALLALSINQLIGLGWMHPRPFMIGLGHMFIEHAPDSSFPSDHATVFASGALTLLLAGERRYGLSMLLAGLAVAWARIFVGVHFPLDMAGAVAVACVAYAVVAPMWKMSGAALTRGFIALYRKLLAWPIGRGWLSS
ncbi:phosphatase PAP2 family protein [Trinickia caryophylli]|uniref:Undecaprenyl-diphosphatase n=1 Tax=Trinickia caryophylli TaxID=28094 RepID=A0A1X7G3U1_TRICW|nr:phosphatase PAP2 family protein [Trinickia caryophylli]PMS13755.1 phosphatase PAP2 family protein [Trinickia caryophylli]TRX14254.1 phosphatase PAP2 family protein [Trinickia caryophylli]WQE14082.1 phosphatase PAP2 family protein [Trinickia caryophylli]SMF63515.1 undecaprenyl-diphosphatase [Trinickia caryophylli]GLU33427.1 undecaprenyl-diphosphatase [Trinickia caryophylli]